MKYWRMYNSSEKKVDIFAALSQYNEHEISHADINFIKYNLVQSCDKKVHRPGVGICRR